MLPDQKYQFRPENGGDAIIYSYVFASFRYFYHQSFSLECASVVKRTQEKERRVFMDLLQVMIHSH